MAGNGNGNGNGNGHAVRRDGKQGAEQSGPRTLIIIGGHEDKKDDKDILREVARRTGGGKIVVTTVASHQPEGYFEEYDRVFHELGLHDVALLEIRDRGEALRDEAVQTLADARGIFFTGGDQLKITSQISDSRVFRRLLEIYQTGGVIAGTSAGASAMCETMLVSGRGEETHRLGDTLNMAPGLGLIHDVIIDQHFAERGRMGRLLGAVAQNPRLLGIGIDEDTAILVEDERRFTVLGSGAVYVVDGSGLTFSNVAEGLRDTTLSLHDVKLHLLGAGDHFDLLARRPGDAAQTEEAQAKEARAMTPERDAEAASTA